MVAMKTQRICHKENLKTTKMYCIGDGDSFNFFSKGNLGLLYVQAKIANWLQYKKYMYVVMLNLPYIFLK